MLMKAVLRATPRCSLPVRKLSTSTTLSKLCSAPFPEFDYDPNFQSYEQLYDYSITQPEKFWDRIAKSRLTWMKPYDKVLSTKAMTGERVDWFLNGKLNASVNCLDRHVATDPNRIALIEEKDDGTSEKVTYRALLDRVCQIANMLKAHGVKRGQHVAIYMPNSALVVATMLACTRIGATHNVLFAGFSADAVAKRLIDSQTRIVITTDQGQRGGVLYEMKKLIDEAIVTAPFVTKVFVSTMKGFGAPNTTMTARDIHFEQELAKYPTQCAPAEMDSEEELFVISTSGAAGRVKSVLHSHAGYLLYSALTHQLVFNYQQGERFACVAELGWITGHSYTVYGPLLNGGTSLLFESHPLYPNPGRYWEMVQRHKLNHIYLFPTHLRRLIMHGDDWVKKYDRSSLKTIGCVGEPLNREAWQWCHDVIGEGRCDVIDTWWQTETGGICLAPRPSAPKMPIKAGTPSGPFFGNLPVIVDDKGKEIKDKHTRGNLCLKVPWPGVAKTFFGDHDYFFRTFFERYPGLYMTGDAAVYNTDGQIQVTGRTDDVISTSGAHVGTAEIEDAIDSHPEVAGSAVVGFPHEIKGEAVYAFVVLRNPESVADPVKLINAIKQQVKHTIAGYAIPEVVHIAENLPETRTTGKVDRRILRRIAKGVRNISQVGDISNIGDLSVVDVLINQRNEMLP